MTPLLLRNGIARMLAESDIEVAGLARDGTEAIALVEQERPDVAILDIRMPPTHTDEGLVAADEIRKRFPATAVLVLSQYVESAYALRLIEGGEGHAGYLLKDRVLDSQQLADAIRRVAAGETVVDQELVGDPHRRAAARATRSTASPTANARFSSSWQRASRTAGSASSSGSPLARSRPTSATSSRSSTSRATPNHNRRVHAVLAYLRG